MKPSTRIYCAKDFLTVLIPKDTGATDDPLIVYGPYGPYIDEEALFHQYQSGERPPPETEADEDSENEIFDSTDEAIEEELAEE